MTGARGVLTGVDEIVEQEWKSTRGAIAEMIHFVGQLQYYILFEVIESSWDELQTAIHKEGCTLDDLIGAHNKYLLAITKKGLLGARKMRHGEEDDNTYMLQLSEILRCMLSYRDAVDGLYSWSVSEFTRRQEELVRAETRQGQPKTTDSEDESASAVPTPTTARRGPRHLAQDSISSTPFPNSLSGVGNEDEMFPALRDRLRALGQQYKMKVSMLLGDLAYQPDVDMRFLGVVMNFNDVYQPVRKGRPKDKGKVAGLKVDASRVGGVSSRAGSERRA